MPQPEQRIETFTREEDPGGEAVDATKAVENGGIKPPREMGIGNSKGIRIVGISFSKDSP